MWLYFFLLCELYYLEIHFKIALQCLGIRLTSSGLRFRDKNTGNADLILDSVLILMPLKHFNCNLTKQKKVDSHQFKTIMFVITVLCGFPGGSMIKNTPANAGDTGNVGLIPGSGKPLKQEMATCSHVLAKFWKIPWAEEPGRLQSLESQRVGHN